MKIKSKLEINIEIFWKLTLNLQNFGKLNIDFKNIFSVLRSIYDLDFSHMEQFQEAFKV